MAEEGISILETSPMIIALIFTFFLVVTIGFEKVPVPTVFSWLNVCILVPEDGALPCCNPEPLVLVCDYRDELYYACYIVTAAYYCKNRTELLESLNIGDAAAGSSFFTDKREPFIDLS